MTYTDSDDSTVWTMEVDHLGNIREDSRRFVGPSFGGADGASLTDGWTVVLAQPGPLEPEVTLDGVRAFSEAWSPAVAVSGRQGLVAAETPQGLAVRVFSFDEPFVPAPAATPLPTPEPTSTPPTSFGPEVELGEGWAPVVAAVPEAFLVGWWSGALELALIRASDGAVLRRRQVGVGARGYALGSNGNEFLVTWTHGTAVHALRIARYGTPINPEISVVWDGGSSPSMSSVTWVGTHWVLTWFDNPRMYIARLGSDGSLLDEPNVIHTGYSLGYDATGIGPRALLTNGYSNVQLEGLVVDIDGSVAGPITLTTGDTMMSGWDISTGERPTLAYVCSRACLPDSSPSAIWRPTLWLVDIDPETLHAIEGTRRRHSWDSIYWHGGVAAAHANRLLIATTRIEDGQTSVYLDNDRLFREADGPRLAIAQGAGIIVTQRYTPGRIVFRTIRFEDLPLAESGPNGPIDVGLRENKRASPRCSASGTRYSLTSVLAALPILAHAWHRRRRRTSPGVNR